MFSLLFGAKCIDIFWGVHFKLYGRKMLTNFPSQIIKSTHDSHLQDCTDCTVARLSPD